MEKELIQLYDAVQKAADAAVDGGGPEEDRCIDALNRLKMFPVGYQVLVSSQVGKRLRGLTKHSSSKIKVLASEVVEIWKDIIVKETTKNKQNGEIKSGGSVKVEKARSVKVEPTTSVKVEGNEKVRYVKVGPMTSVKVEGNEKVRSVKVESVASVKVEGNNVTGTSNHVKKEYMEYEEKDIKVDVLKTKLSPPAEQVKVEKRIKEERSTSWTSEQIKVENRIKEEKPSSNFSKVRKEPVGTPKLGSVVYCKDAVRDKMREILAEALCKVSREVDEDLKHRVDECDPYRVAVLVETAMFEKWGKSNGIQKAKYRSIMFNIKDANNPDFRRKVLLGEFAPDTITELTPEQMASDARKQQIEGIKKKALFECERGQKQEASTNKFKCSRCGKKETTYYQMQTRSADEPMTTYVTCVNCGNRWKFC